MTTRDGKVERKSTRLPKPYRRIKVLLFERGLTGEDLAKHLGIHRQTCYGLLAGHNRNSSTRRKVQEFLGEPVWRDFFISELAYVLSVEPSEVWDSVEGLYDDSHSTVPARLRALAALLKESREISGLIAQMQSAMEDAVNQTQELQNEQHDQEAKGRERPENGGGDQGV